MKALAISIALTAATIALPPAAHANMTVANYELQTQRDTGHAWLWAVRPCLPSQPTECRHIQAIPRPNGQAVPYDGETTLVNGHYTMVIDVPDGVRCTVYFLPSHDVYNWDATTLTGSVDSTFDTSCGNGPGGTVNYPFALVRY